MLTVLWLAFGAGQYRHDFVIIVDKHELLAATPSPKIVLMGGSGLIYGIDSGLLAKEFGVHVTNVGFYAGCGSAFAADYIVPYLSEGDVVVLIPEYHQFISGLDFNDFRCRAWMARALFPRIPLALYQQPRDLFLDVLFLARAKIGSMLRWLPHRFSGVVPGDSAYFRQEFDEHGDKRSGFDATPVLRDYERIDFDKPAIDRANVVLREFARRVEGRKAQFRIVPPATAASWYVNEQGALERLFAGLDPKFLLGQPKDYVYDDALFQDTIYHLGPVGRRLRTERLSEAIRKEGLLSP
jgi:hypothetical protein